MKTNIGQKLSRRTLQAMTLGTICVIGAFTLGLRSAGEVQTIASLDAHGTVERGDMDGNGTVDMRDVQMLLEIVQTYKQPTSLQLRADPNGDGTLTLDDALLLLERLRQE